MAGTRETAQNGYACRDFRIKAKLTVDQAAALADISAPHLRNIEHEHRSASDVHLERLAEIYDVRVNSLRRQPVSQRTAVPA